ADGRAYAPDNAWMHADDGFDRSLQAFENHYFHCPGECTLILPIGDARVQVSHGLDYAIAERNVAITTKGNTSTISLEPLRLPAQYGHFASADLHVHMNYGGHYHNTPQNLIEQARAEHLDAVYNLIVNKEERIPDVAQFTTKPLRKDNVLLMQAQEFHSSYWDIWACSVWMIISLPRISSPIGNRPWPVHIRPMACTAALPYRHRAMVGETTPEKLHAGLKQGRTFVTNGPLLGLEINGKHPGDEITLAKPTTLPYHASLRSIVAIDHFELIFNGRVIASHRLEEART